MNAQDRIHYYLIEEAKNLLLSSNKTVGELTFALGFEYPQYFSRLFKSKTGMTPLEYRNLNQHIGPSLQMMQSHFSIG